MSKKILFPIALKLSLFFIVILLATLLGSGYYIYKESSHTVETMVNQQFNQALNMAKNHFDLLEHMNKMLVNNLAEEHELIHNIVANDNTKLRNLIADKRHDIQCDEIILLDNNANVITQSGSIPFEGNTLQNLQIVNRTLSENKPFTTIIRQYDIFVLYASTPIMIQNVQHGMLLMGFSINNIMMQNIKKDTIMEFTIIGDRAVAATSFNIDGKLMQALPMPYLDYLWLLKYPNRFYEAKVGDKNYYLTARTLQNIDQSSHASLLMAYPANAVQEHEANMIDSILIAISVSLLLSFILIIIFAKKIRHIFKTMISHTQKVRKGDYKQRLELKTNDEFELLSHNFNAMTQSLNNQHETIVTHARYLEEKVEKRTQELNEQKQSLEHILNIHPSMILTIQNNDILYANQIFLDFFKTASMENIKTKNNLCLLFKAEMMKCHEEDSIKTFIKSLFEKENNIVTLYSGIGERKVFEIDFISIESQSSKEIVVFKDVTRLSIEKDILEEQAIRDTLTGQYNRIKFNKELEKALYSVERYNNNYTVVICDIDNFKKINDTYGHIVGDYALITLSEIFSKRVRTTDIFARWGGEEFVLLLNLTDAKEAELFTNSLREELARYNFDNFGQLTCSFGVTQIAKGDTMQTLMDRADKGLYYAKEHGKNMVKVM